MRRPVLRTVPVLLLALLVACSTAADPGSDSARPAPAAEPDGEADAGDGTGGGTPPSPSSPSPAANAPEVAELDFAVPGVGGGQVEGAALAGRDVALWFWAPW